MSNRSRFACERCKRSKRKCDGIPDVKGCTVCHKAGVECSILHHQEQTTKYIAQLEAKIKYLESDAHSGTAGPAMKLVSHPPAIREPTDKLEFGPSLSFIFRRALDDSPLNEYQDKFVPEALESPPSKTGPPDYTRLMEDDEMGKRLIESCMKLMFSRFPFIHREYAYELHRNRKEVLRTSETRQDAIKRFVLLMIYAIGLRVAQMIKAETLEGFTYYQADDIYADAAQDLERICAVVDIDSVRCLILVAYFMLRSSRSHQIWHLCGLIIRLCVDLNLHRRESRPVPVEELHDSVMRRRVFWSAYVIERSVCMHFGRPMCLSDYDIDAELPYNIDDSVTDCHELDDIINKHPEKMGPTVITDMTVGICLIQLRRIDSVIHHSIYRVDQERDIVTLVKDIGVMYERVQQWKNDLPAFDNEDNQLFMTLLYHKTMRILLVPLISKDIEVSNSPEAQFFVDQCVKSCGTICLLAKRLIQLDWYCHSFIAIHTLFVSAMTLIYCLLTGRLEWTVEMSTCLQSCSTALFVVGERMPFTKSFLRDAYERVLNKTMEQMSKKETVNKTKNYRIGGVNVLDKPSELDISLLQEQKYPELDLNESLNTPIPNDFDELWQIISDQKPFGIEGNVALNEFNYGLDDGYQY
ncbi:hypothetical protein KL931_001783 [Ogataea haglerorum]|nr:hypothetical protein KL923_001783 [Ogataea haglerorum]KAG7755247.1 hypothetical protein KL947_004435 [Ogataea haglerorum]KAG7770961.1 hypothetical protein KL931_001783 [Ogataea haglerorum]